MIYFTADTHFFHKSIIGCCDRPFESVEEMNQVLARNWNSVVAKRDEIYILGDFAYRAKAGEVNRLLASLNGRKYLIKGNHDDFLEDNGFVPSAFEWVKDYYVLRHERRKFVLFHYPILEWDGFFHDAIHLYGHVHNNGTSIEQHERFSLNVGVDVNDFLPVSIKTVLERAGEFAGG